MKEKQLEALIISRDSWHRKFMSHLNGEEPEYSSCELCVVFSAASCKNCPVKIKVNQLYCRETPYISYLTASNFRPEDHELLAELAHKEFKFLNDLVMEYLR